MSTITWIIIVLIVISIGVTVSEVVLRFSLLEREKGKGNGKDGSGNELAAIGSARNLSQIRATLSGEDMQALCGMDVVGTTFAGV